MSRVTPVHTALRNCMRDEGRPFGFGDQVADPKPPQAAVARERREQVTAIWLGSTGNGRNPMFNVKSQPSSHHNSQGGRVRETCGLIGTMNWVLPSRLKLLDFEAGEVIRLSTSDGLPPSLRGHYPASALQRNGPLRGHCIRWPSVWAAMVYRLDVSFAVGRQSRWRTTTERSAPRRRISTFGLAV